MNVTEGNQERSRYQSKDQNHIYLAHSNAYINGSTTVGLTPSK